MASAFTITTASNNLTLDKSQRVASVTYTVTNSSGQEVHGRAALATVPDNAPHLAWLAIDGESERPFIIGATEQYRVTISAPADAAPGNYTFRLNMVATHNPDETFSAGPTMTITAPEAKAATGKFPIWIIPVILLVLAGIAAAVFLATRSKAVAVPDVVGLSEEAAGTEIAGVGLGIGRIGEENSAQEVGRIARSAPSAGTEVPKNSNVDLYLSSGLPATPTPTHTPIPPTVTPTATPSPPVICAGQTQPGATDWLVYDPSTVYVDINTDCGLSETPLYFTSIGGSTNHFIAIGHTSIYQAQPNSFRVYVRDVREDAPIDPALANSYAWAINWMAVPVDLNYPDICIGQTASTGWKTYDQDIGLDVDTSQCNFANGEDIVYMTSLGGESSHWSTTGATSIYAADSNSFQVYLHYTPGAMTPDTANDWGWHINWLAVRRGLRLPSLCSGRTTTGAGWQQYSADTVLLGIDTTSCAMTGVPLYFASIYGDNIWRTTGASAIYAPNPESFTVYIRNSRAGSISPSYASSQAWRMAWLAVPTDQ